MATPQTTISAHSKVAALAVWESCACIELHGNNSKNNCCDVKRVVPWAPRPHYEDKRGAALRVQYIVLLLRSIWGWAWCIRGHWRHLQISLYCQLTPLGIYAPQRLPTRIQNWRCICMHLACLWQQDTLANMFSANLIVARNNLQINTQLQEFLNKYIHIRVYKCSYGTALKYRLCMHHCISRCNVR